MDATAQQRGLAAIARRVAACHDCRLYQGTTNPVPGEGDPQAEIMFIGEGPGFYEDRQGRPFVGASGKFLDELLASVGLARSQVFITNIVKHRPPNNRDPQPDEVLACKKHLDAQVETIAPKVIVTLGRHSMQRYFPGEAIGRVHGQPRRKDDVIVVPMYHPAAALHQQTLRRVIESDFAKLPDFLARALGREAAPEVAPIPEQLRREPVPAPASETAQTVPHERQMRLM
jgi:DNA polymerase